VAQDIDVAIVHADLEEDMYRGIVTPRALSGGRFHPAKKAGEQKLQDAHPGAEGRFVNHAKGR